MFIKMLKKFIGEKFNVEIKDNKSNKKKKYLLLQLFFSFLVLKHATA